VTDLSRAPRKPFAHQRVGVDWLLPVVDPAAGRVLPGGFFLGDEMRLGKTAQVIMAMQVLFEAGEIDTVIIVSPAPVRDVWCNPVRGEIKKHRWAGVPTVVTEYHAVVKEWAEDPAERYLRWVVTNYEYIRSGVRRQASGWSGPNLAPLFQICGKRTALVIDESAALASFDSLQTRACFALRQRCARVVLLNGTPITEDPEDLFSQAKMIDWRILGFKYISQYRARYAIMGGHVVEVYGKKIPTQILGWRHQPRPAVPGGRPCCSVPLHLKSPVHEPGPGLEEIQQKLAPYVLRRLRSEWLDAPVKLDPVILTATLKPDTWRVYVEMRDELVSWLDRQTVAISPQAGVLVMRLAQITSGFLGGLLDNEALCPHCGGSGRAGVQAPAAGGPEGLNLAPEGPSGECPGCGGEGVAPSKVPPREVGREKLDVLLWWVKKRLKEDPEFRMLVWCRFRPELERLVRELSAIVPNTLPIYGGQKKDERERGLTLMHSTSQYAGPAILVGTIGTGALGLDMAGAHEVVFASTTSSLYKRSQSEDRPLGAAQTQAVSYHDIVAVGPKGQRTIDHEVLAALQDKNDVATWTCSAWASALRKE
jgi:SNF2 domain-containing protein